MLVKFIMCPRIASHLIAMIKLNKTLIVITMASLFILFYTFKTEEEIAQLNVEKKSGLKVEGNGELERKNSELKEEKLNKKKSELNENNSSGGEVEFCAPKTNILFLKTHKTASTTVMVLFHRFATKHQLIVADVVYPYNYTKFDRCSIYPLKPGNEYNIFAEHAMFNYEKMKNLMPENTTFLTILRDPAEQFESAYGYFFLDSLYGMNITTFADLDTSLPEWSRVKNLRKNGKNGRNHNCFDLGIAPELFDDEAAILRKVEELDQQLDLVIITELFNESMILMKEKLCWKELSDIMVMKSNVRTAGLKVDLSSEQKMKLREKNRADQILYDYFYQKLLKQIDAFGKEKMEEEVRKLRALTEEIEEVCLEYKLVDRLDKPETIIRSGLRAGAANHKVCQPVLRDEKGKSYKKFSQSKFAEAVKCED